MKTLLLSTLAAMAGVICCAAGDAPPWEDETVSAINRLPARSGIKPEDGRFTMSLDGEWDFTFVNGDQREECKMPVPSCWQIFGMRNGKDWDPPLYVNSLYPIAYDPPRVMTAPKDEWWTSFRFRNPHGIYRRKVALPPSWKGRRLVLRLNGYSSAVYVRVNGKMVGYGEDGRLPNEWDLTPYADADFDLEIEVLKHSDATYIEDQDMWRLSGLFRSVELISESGDAIFDFHVEMKCDAGLRRWTLDVKTVGGEKGKMSAALFDASGKKAVDLKRTSADTLGCTLEPRLWSQKDPYLYTLKVKSAGDVYSKKIGFRSVTIENGVLKLNGERVVIHGVDRHEVSPVGGYAMTREEMEKDMALFRRFNINSVRTSHYPDDLYWYDLCDANGILVVAEANIEAHGSGHPYSDKALSHLPSWKSCFVERNTNQVAVLRDHPSVIAWSLCNESGNGANLIAAYDAVKAMDKTRPVQCEGFYNPYGAMRFDVQGSDIICPMYESTWGIERAMEKNFGKPYILCEYMYAEGNAGGNMDEYMALLDRHPSFQGGFIWEFADHAIFDAKGRLRYGGDFGDQPNNAQVCCNGIFDALRRPQPAAYEVGYWYGGRKQVPFDVAKDAAKASDGAATFDPSTIRLSFWRASTNIDWGHGFPRTADVWKKATESQALPKGAETNLVVVKTAEGYRVDFTMSVDGTLPEIPRVGLSFEVPGTSETVVSWHGAGPWENYSDRKSSAAVGDYSFTVAKLNDSHYVQPQECGHRTDTDRLDVGGLAVEAVGKPFEWNVFPWRVHELDRARHADDLPKDTGRLTVFVDAAMRGVGGDDGWGARVHEQYRLEGARTYSLSFTVGKVR